MSFRSRLASLPQRRSQASHRQRRSRLAPLPQVLGALALVIAGVAARADVAVPELRVHVARTTAAIARSLGSGAGSYLRRIATPIFRRTQPTF